MSQVHYKQQLNLHNRNTRMPEQASFGESMVLNLRRQRKIMTDKIDQIDELLQLIDNSEGVVQFAELMQKLQTNPAQQPQ
jgi:hypothetical protein